MQLIANAKMFLPKPSLTFRNDPNACEDLVCCMGIVAANLIPLIIGAAVGGPMWVITALLMLRGEGGVLKAAAFAAGATTTRLLQGILFGYVFGAAAEAGGERGATLIESTLLLVVGVFLLVTAVRTWCKDDDPDAPPPQWMTSLGGVSALGAFGIGALAMALAMKQWIFTLSALAVIEEAKLGYARSVLMYLFFIVAAQSLMLAPIISSAVAPTQPARMVEVMQAWLERYNRVIAIVASLIFGAWLLAKGASGLLASSGGAAS